MQILRAMQSLLLRLFRLARLRANIAPFHPGMNAAVSRSRR